MIFNPYVVQTIGGETTGDYTEQLSWYLTELGVSLTGNEDTDELIELFTRVEVGDRRVECCSDMAWVEGSYQNVYGFLLPNTLIGIDRNTFSIGEINKIRTMRLRIESLIPDTIVITAPGWTVTREIITVDDSEEREEIILSCPFAPGITRFIAYDELAKIRITANAASEFFMRMEADGEEREVVVEPDDPSEESYTQTVYDTYYSDTIRVLYSYSTWASVEVMYPTWDILERHTWTEIEAGVLHG